MTYEQLARKIASMNAYQRKCDVTFFNDVNDKFFALTDLYENSGETDVLDEGHPYLIMIRSES